MQNRPFAGSVAAILIGLLFGFFLVLNAIFSDVFTWQERVFSFLLILAAYTAAGLVFGYLSPIRFLRWGFLLGGPAVFFVVAFTLSDDSNRLLLHLFYILLTLGSSLLGAYFGARLRKQGR